MKLTPLVLWTLLLLPIASFADDFTLTDGREYKDATVTRVEQDGIVVITNDGVEKLPFSLLSKEVQLAYPYKGPTATPSPTPDMDEQIKALEAKDAAEAAKATPKPDVSGTNTGNEAADSHKPPYGRFYGLLAGGGVAFLVLFATLLVGSFFARRLVKCCALRQKQREFDSTNAQQFHTAYMDFFAIWKLWNHYIEQHGEAAELPDHGEYEIPHATRWELLTRAYIAEGSVDAVFLKISSARKLAPGEIETLGRFRQAFHALGLAIKNNKALAWKDAEHPDYLVFKRLASGVAVLINGENLGAQAADVRADSFRQITSNRWERSWSSESSHPSTDTK